MGGGRPCVQALAFKTAAAVCVCVVRPTNAKLRGGSNLVITPFKALRADFKIEEESEDREKIDEVSGFWAVFMTLNFSGVFGQMACADGLRCGEASPLGAEPPQPPGREIYHPQRA